MGVLNVLAMVILVGALAGVWRARDRGPRAMRTALLVFLLAMGALGLGWFVIHRYSSMPPTSVVALTSRNSTEAARMSAYGGGVASEPSSPDPFGAVEDCDVPVVDTTQWRPLTSRHGTFVLHLPGTAVEVPLPCIDSPCGEITAGELVLSYDSGPLAGPGTRLTQRPGIVVGRTCRLQTDEGRTFLVGLGRYTAATPLWRPTVGGYDIVPRGSFTVEAVMALSDSSGLYVSMHSRRPEDQARIITALRTLRVLRAHQAAPRVGS